jgi:tRNA A-37 threonylcarbamoyl transferase component Bud32
MGGVDQIARLDFEIRRVENETRAYGKLKDAEFKHPDILAPAYAFLGHLAENRRVVGMLIEKLEGGRAGIEDISACEDVVRRVHVLEIVHGDLNKHNFVVDEQNGILRLIDFENERDYSDVESKKEIESLKD